MQPIAPYQIGLWLAEYLSMRCQLCRLYRSVPPHLQTTTPSCTTPQSDYSATDKRNKFSLLQKALPSNKGLLCPLCHASIAWLPAPFTVDLTASTALSIQAATYYDYPIRQAIRAFKHSEDMTTLPLLVHVLRQIPRPTGCHSANSVILPMPTTSRRLAERGFDPVTILSAYLSQHWGIPIWRGVQRVDHTISQQGLSRAERLTNLNEAFVLTKLPAVKRILLFDDVATTGASLQALAYALQTKSPLYILSAYALAHGSASN